MGCPGRNDDDRKVRRQSVSRRPSLAGTAGVLGGAALPGGGAVAQNNAGGDTGAAANFQSNRRYCQDPAWAAPLHKEIIEPGMPARP
jgi:hypothetical protein